MEKGFMEVMEPQGTKVSVFGGSLVPWYRQAKLLSIVVKVWMAKGHVVGAMWHLYFMHSEDVFYAHWISLILAFQIRIWFAGSTVENCRGCSVVGICFRIFTGGSKQFLHCIAAASQLLTPQQTSALKDVGMQRIFAALRAPVHVNFQFRD